MEKVKNKTEEVTALVKNMQPQDQVAELISWRLAVPKIQAMVIQLNEFKQFASSADELTKKVSTLTARYEATIQFREEQLKELMKMIESIQSDPIGASKHIDHLAALSLKKKLN